MDLGPTEDNQDQIVLRPEHFATLTATAVHAANPLEEWIRASSEREAEVLRGLEALRKDKPRKLTDGTWEWEEDNGLVYYRGRLYIPPEDGL